MCKMLYKAYWTPSTASIALSVRRVRPSPAQHPTLTAAADADTAANRYFPTILIVLLAVFNDGAMIALSKDRVQPSPTPNSWRLRDIFIIGIVYGLYLTISTWVLYHVSMIPSAASFVGMHAVGMVL